MCCAFGLNNKLYKIQFVFMPSNVGAQIPGIRFSGQLPFLWWYQIFVGLEKELASCHSTGI